MNLLDYLIIAAYLFFMLGLGAYFRHQKSAKDYYLAGRTLDWKPLSLSIMATQLSAVSFISAPAFVGLREGGGLVWLSYELALPLAMLLLLHTLMPVLHQAGVTSVYDYLEQRIGRSTRLLLSFVFQISRAFATGIMIYALSIVLQSTLAIPQWQSIVLVGVITLIYAMQGGMKAVVIGDAIQMILIVCGTVICLVAGLYHLGGWEVLLQQVDPARISALNLSSVGFDDGGFGLLPMLFGGIVLYAAYYGCDQSEAQRYLSAKDTSDLRKMVIAAALLRFPVTLLYCLTGLVIGTLAWQNSAFMQSIPQDHPDWMMPQFILQFLPHGLIGLLVVAVFAAAMSSLSSAINSLSAATNADLKRALPHKSERDQLKFARLTSLVWGLVTLLMAFVADSIADTVIEAINKVGSMFFGPILATFLLAIRRSACTERAANLGIVLGVGLNMLLWQFVEQLFWFWWNMTGFVAAYTVAAIANRLQRSVKQDVSRPTYRAPASVNALLIGWCLIIFAICALLPGWLG